MTREASLEKAGMFLSWVSLVGGVSIVRSKAWSRHLKGKGHSSVTQDKQINESNFSFHKEGGNEIPKTENKTSKQNRRMHSKEGKPNKTDNYLHKIS